MTVTWGAKRPDAALPWPILWEGVELCAEMERCALKSYLCPAGVWTNGWGETDGVVPGMVWSQEFSDQRFCDSLTAFTTQVRKLLKVATSDHELAALVVFAYNVGIAAFAKSSVLRLHNAGDRQGASRAFNLWNKAKNKNTGKLEVLDGLTKRRALEQALYLTPDSGTPIVMPQAVASESTMAASPINKGAAATVATGAITGLTSLAGEVKGVMGTLKEVVVQVTDFIGVTPQQGLAIVLLAAGAYVMYWRYQQRKQGWV